MRTLGIRAKNYYPDQYEHHQRTFNIANIFDLSFHVQDFFAEKALFRCFFFNLTMLNIKVIQSMIS